MRIVLIIVIAIHLVAADWPQGIDLLAGCDSTYINETGIIASPNFPNPYPQNSNCTWLIFGAAGKNVQLTFSSFVLEENRDFVKIYDGPSLSSPLLLNHSGFDLPTPNPVVSSANSMLVHLTSNAAVQYSGFRASYESIIATTTTPIPTTEGPTTLPPNSNCGGTLYGSGVIRSPHYPDAYDPTTNCTWLLQSASPYVSLNFTAFDTENKIDYVEIWDGWNTTVAPVEKFSGDLAGDLPFYQSETGNKMSLRFISDETEQRTGFEADFY